MADDVDDGPEALSYRDNKIALARRKTATGPCAAQRAWKYLVSELSRLGVRFRGPAEFGN